MTDWRILRDRGLALEIDPVTGERHIQWQLTDPPPLDRFELRWDGYAIRLLAVQDAGGGLIVQLLSQVAFTLEITTPHTTYIEIIPVGDSTLTLTVLDRTDVQANCPRS